MTHQVETDPTIFNVITGSEYREAFRGTLDEVIRSLAPHCGPFASNAVIPTNIVALGKELVDRYTKDGISIARNMSSLSPLSRYVLRLVTHIGENVDAACHDGTTTSMLWFCLLAEELFSEIPDGIAPPQRVRFSKSIFQALELAKDVITTNSLQVEDLRLVFRGRNLSRDQVRHCLAYHQAYIASKGDAVLSDGVARVVAGMPEEMYGYYEIMPMPTETDRQYVVQKREYDYGFASSMNRMYYNTRLSTELELDHADLMITETDFSNRSPIACFLSAAMLCDQAFRDKLADLQKLERIASDIDYGPDEWALTIGESYWDRPMMVVAPMSPSDPVFTEFQILWNKMYPERRVITASLPADAMVKQAVVQALNATAGKRPMEIDTSRAVDAIIRDTRITHTGNYITIDRLYEKTGDLFHPFYMDKDLFPYYTETLEAVQMVIERARTQHTSKLTKSNVMTLVGVYRTMTCQQVYDLYVGGTTLETTANRDVVNDAYGAALSAVTTGVVMGGYQKIHQKFLKDTTLPEDTREAFGRSLNELTGWVFTGEGTTSLPDSYFKTGLSKTNYFIPVVNDEGIARVEKKSLITQLDDFLRPWTALEKFPDDQGLTDERHVWLEKKTVTILFQPVAGYFEQFRRLRAILPGLVNSTQYINPDMKVMEQ